MSKFEAHQETNIWSFCRQQILDDNATALLIILETKGSSPGKPGFKMAVSKNGELRGSVGGGSAEYEAVERARKILKKNIAKPQLMRQVHSADAEESSGMICAGEQTLAIVPLTKESIAVIEKIERAQDTISNIALHLSPAGIDLVEKQECNKIIVSDLSSEGQWDYTEPQGLTETIYIFGGGHVSVELSKVMRMLGFYIKIFDNRPEISTLHANESAHEKHVIDFANAGSYVHEGEGNYIVIMTVGHMHDLEVLTQMVGKKVTYLGMMGSKSKVSIIHQLLHEKGFNEQEIGSVHMPIGEQIYSHTPKEIAISIAAEIIKIKNQPA